MNDSCVEDFGGIETVVLMLSLVNLNPYVTARDDIAESALAFDEAFGRSPQA